MARRHTITLTALRSDHATYTVDGNLSYHSAGRAMDLSAVDGETCRGTRVGAGADLVPRTRRRHRGAARDRAQLLLGPRRVRRPTAVRARRPL